MIRPADTPVIDTSPSAPHAPVPRPDLTIVVPDGESHYALPVVTSLARSARHRVHVVSSDPAARVRWSRHIASFTAAPAGDGARWDAMRGVVDRVGADVVLPVCETGVRMLQSRRDALAGRVALPPCAGTLDVGDKWLLAAMLREQGIPHPATLLYDGDAARLDAFPVLVKPRRSSGGHGIRAFHDRASLAAWIARHPERAHAYVVQAFVPGHDVGANVLCRDGRVLAHSLQRPVAGSRGYDVATEVEMIDHPGADALLRRLVASLGWSGVANVDLRVDERDGRVTVLEVNPRYWSSLLAADAAGVPFPHLACLAARGIEFQPPRARLQRFVQAGASARAWGRWLTGRTPDAPAFHDTVWPYLLADPMPHLMGRLAAVSRPSHRDGARGIRCVVARA